MPSTPISTPEKLLKQHDKLVHTEMAVVTSHVQRTMDGQIQNTIMIKDCDVPFKYKRQKKYKDVTGQRVNLTYYPSTETVAGLEFDIMKVVRIKIS